MSANLENSAVATVLEKVSFHSNPKERQFQRMFNLSCHCAHLTCQQGNAHILLAKFQQYMNQKLLDMQTGLSNQRSNCQHSLDHRESKGIPEKKKKNSVCFTDYAKPFHCVDHNKLWTILKEMGVPDHLTFLLTSLYVGQKAAIRFRHGTTERFKIGTGA